MIRTLMVLNEILPRPFQENITLCTSDVSILLLAFHDIVHAGHESILIPLCAVALLPLDAAYVAELGAASAC